MKFLIFFVFTLIAASCSSTSTTHRNPSSEHPAAGDVYKVSFDPASAFAKSGEKFVIGVDWERVWSVLTDQETKNNAIFCSRQLETAHKNNNEINRQIKASKYSSDQASIMKEFGASGLQGARNLCVGLLSAEEVEHINDVVVDSLKAK